MPQPESLRIVTEDKLELFINTQAASPVATIAELPAANSGNMGLIRFVTSENEPYYSNGTTWSSIAQGSQGEPGPAGAGVPSGGEALQIIRKNSVGTTTEWVSPNKAIVGLSNVDNTSDTDKPVSSATQAALNLKASTSDLTAGLAGKADLQSGKVPVAQLPTDDLVTDANVAAQVNGAQTGPAIDQRINTQVTPQVEQIASDYISSQPAVVDAAAAAVDANPDISSVKSRLTVLDGQGQRGYTIDQSAGRVVKIWDYLNNREQVIYGDTGWRDVSSWVRTDRGYTVSFMQVRRVGGTVHIRFADATGGTGTFFTPTAGFRVSASADRYWAPVVSKAGAVKQLRGNNYGFIVEGVTESDVFNCYAIYETSDPWPSTLPGVAA